MSQVITNAFEQYWQSCLAAEKPVVLDEFILADIPNLDITSPIDPETGLPPESQIVHRQNVDQRGRINNNAVAYTIVMDTTVGDFSFNAMYLRNKQNGVIGMIVYKGRETKLKTDQTTGQTGNSLVKSMLMGYDQAAEATLTHVDAGTWQIDYAARLRGMDEDIRQLQADLYGHHTFVGDGFKVVEKDGAYQVTQGVAIIGGLRVELKAPEVIHPGTKPIGIWVDVHRAGSLLSEHQNHFTIITSVADLADHVDSNGYQHYVAKLATVRADGTIEDGRGSAGGGTAGGFTDRIASMLRSDVIEWTSGLIFRKSVALSLPFKFPDYDAAYKFVGSPSYIYPQGHCYDLDGNIYIKYARGTYAVIVWYKKTGGYGGYFYIQLGGESLVIKTSVAGVKTLYNRGGDSRLYSYDITIMPANGSIVPHVDVGLSSVGLQYAYDAGRWIIEQSYADVGYEGSRTKWNIYNDSFAKVGEFFVKKTIVGWQLPESSLYEYVPKSQGICLKGGKVIFGLGGSYSPASDGPCSKPVAALGIAEVSLDGSLLGYGALNATKLLDRLNADGYPSMKTESEGVTLRDDGAISHLVVNGSHDSPGNTQNGVLIFIEKDSDGDDYSSFAEPYTPMDIARTYTGIFPRGVDGKMHNPFNDEIMTSMEQLILYLKETQSPRMSWYTSAVTIEPLPGISLPAGMVAEIQNANNLTFLVTVTGASAAATSHIVRYNEATSSCNVIKLGTDAVSLRVGELDSSDNVTGKISVPHRTEVDADILALNQLSTTGGNLLVLGGGSSLFYAATRIWQYVGSTMTTKRGTCVTETYTNGFNPGEHLGFDLGTLVKAWKTVFASEGNFSGPVKFGQFTMATMPSPSAYRDWMITVTDASGGAKVCRSNGSVWQIINTTTTVS